MVKKKKRRVVKKQPVSIISDEITIPNHSGDHTAGTTGTPVTDLDIANKKYVDDNAVSDHSALTNLEWSNAGHIMDADLEFENAATRSVKIDDARSNTNADDLNILAGNTVFHVSSALDGGNVIIDGGVAQGAGTTGVVKIANTRGVAILGDGSKLVTNAAPNADAEIANKKYVDDEIVASPHTPEGTAVKSTGEAGGTKFLREDGDGTSSWQPPAASAPGGSDTQVQFNDAGSFGGDANLTWNKTNEQLLLSNGLVGTPVIAAVNDPNTGMWFGPGSPDKNIFFSVGGIQRLDIGNVAMTSKGRINIQVAGSPTLNALVLGGANDTGLSGGSDDIQIYIDAKENMRCFRNQWIRFNRNLNNIDFGISGDTAAQLFLLDAGLDVIKMGDGGSTNYMQVDVAGKILFTGASGLAYGEIYVNDNTTVTSVSNAGFTQFLHFAVNGHNQNTSPDHTNDHITITKAGVYMVDCCVNIKNDSGAAHDIEVVLSKNNNNVIFANLRRHRTLGTGTDIGAIPICGHISLAVNDTLEVWITSDSASARDVIAEDVTLMVTQVGGT